MQELMKRKQEAWEDEPIRGVPWSGCFTTDVGLLSLVVPLR